MSASCHPAITDDGTRPPLSLSYQFGATKAAGATIIRKAEWKEYNNPFIVQNDFGATSPDPGFTEPGFSPSPISYANNDDGWLGPKTLVGNVSNAFGWLGWTQKVAIVDDGFGNPITEVRGWITASRWAFTVGAGVAPLPIWVQQDGGGSELLAPSGSVVLEFVEDIDNNSPTPPAHFPPAILARLIFDF